MNYFWVVFYTNGHGFITRYIAFYPIDESRSERCEFFDTLIRCFPPNIYHLLEWNSIDEELFDEMKKKYPDLILEWNNKPVNLEHLNDDI